MKKVTCYRKRFCLPKSPRVKDFHFPVYTGRGKTIISQIPPFPTLTITLLELNVQRCCDNLFKEFLLSLPLVSATTNPNPWEKACHHIYSKPQDVWSGSGEAGVGWKLKGWAFILVDDVGKYSVSYFLYRAPTPKIKLTTPWGKDKPAPYVHSTENQRVFPEQKLTWSHHV